MKLLLALTLPLLLAAGPATTPATQPSLITLHAKDMPPKTLLAELSRQTNFPIPLSPLDLLDKNQFPNLTLDLNAVSFWQAMELISQKTTLEPLINPDDPYPRFVLGVAGGSFWEEPHVVTGPIVLFVNDLQRSNVVELGKKKPDQYDRRLTINLTAFVEPGLVVLSASQQLKVKEALDSQGHRLKPASATDPDLAPAPDATAAGLYNWNLALALDCPVETAPKIASLKAITNLRIQTATEKLEIDDISKSRNVSRVVAGVPFTFRSLKKADNEYILAFQIKRDKKSPEDWQNIYHSILSGRIALYDDKARLVASRGTEMGVDFTNNRLDATLRFAREPGATDPQAGEPYKLLWLIPTASKDLALEFELKDLPVPP